MIDIRPYRDTDRPAVVAIWERCGLTRPWNDPGRDIARKQAVDDGLFLVAVHSGDAVGDEAVVGSAMFGYDGHRGWVNYLAVDPDHQGQDIARTLMDRGEEMLIRLGCPKLNLQVRSDNRNAIAMYRRLGYDVDDVVSLGKRLIPDPSP